MLDLVEGRRIFADYLQGNYFNSKSLDAALMAALKWAYVKGLEDGATTVAQTQVFMAEASSPADR